MAVEVCPEPLSVTGEPTGVPLGHRAAEVVGPHSVKVMVPPGTPPVVLPVTVAVSVTLPVGPITIEPGPEDVVDCWVAVDDGAGVTVKHSVAWTSPVTLSDEPR